MKKFTSFLKVLIINTFKIITFKNPDCYNCIYKVASENMCLPPNKDKLIKCYRRGCIYEQRMLDNTKLDEIFLEIKNGYRNSNHIIKNTVLLYPTLDITREINVYKQKMLLNNNLITRVEINTKVNEYAKQLGVDYKKYKSRQFAIQIIEELKNISTRYSNIGKQEIISEILKFIEQESANFENYNAIRQFEEDLGRSREEDINVVESLYRIYLCLRNNDDNKSLYYKSFEDFLRQCNPIDKEKLIKEFVIMLYHYENPSVFPKSSSEVKSGN